MFGFMKTAGAWINTVIVIGFIMVNVMAIVILLTIITIAILIIMIRISSINVFITHYMHKLHCHGHCKPTAPSPPRHKKKHYTAYKSGIALDRNCTT